MLLYTIAPKTGRNGKVWPRAMCKKLDAAKFVRVAVVQVVVTGAELVDQVQARVGPLGGFR